MEHAHEASERLSWVILGLILAFIFMKGIFTFVVVGDLGPADWDYRPVMDVPGQSPYAIYEVLPNAQHVRGSGGE